jgi:nicotinamidase/pyrazinamidase
MQEKDALLVVDVQNDFCPGGALPVGDGEWVVPVLNECIEKFKMAHLPIFATRDWHPEKTRHFNSFGGTWPPHCIKETRGADFHSALAVTEYSVIISKGMDPEEDCYSGFEGVDEQGVKLSELLRRHGVERLFVGGLATDYCIKFTVLDGIKEGFKVVLLKDAIKGVNLEFGDAERAIAEMTNAGAETKESSQISSI